jgi:hypothetical protein
MSFDRQLDVLVAVLLAVVTFLGCIFSAVMSVRVSALVSVGVFLATLVFGRRIADVILDIFGAA